MEMSLNLILTKMKLFFFDEIDEEVTTNSDESDDVENQQPDGLEKPLLDFPQQQFDCKDCVNIITK